MMHDPLYIDIHALQTVPPSCINRDDTGSPKTARFGGVTRARVSSQAWKKAMRDEFAAILDEDEIGSRTKHSVELIAAEMRNAQPDLDSETADKWAAKALAATGVKVNAKETGYLLFMSPLQGKALAKLALDAMAGDGKVNAKEAKAILNPKQRPTLNAIDIALFGRMVADAPDLNVDAAVQVAHALGIGPAETEFDYYTAMDDRSPEDSAGAGMIGTVEYLSATFYRYATIDVFHLYENLGSVAATVKAVQAFCTAFVRSMPTGKQNTFANRTLPSAVLVQLRDTQPVSLVNAYERPVHAMGDKSQAAVACERMVEQARAIDDAFGTAPLRSYAVCTTPDTQVLGSLATTLGSLQEVSTGLGADVESYLSSCGIVDEAQE